MSTHTHRSQALYTFEDYNKCMQLTQESESMLERLYKDCKWIKILKTPQHTSNFPVGNWDIASIKGPKVPQ